MKRFMAWTKSNLAIVILSAVMIVALPAAFIVSSMLNRKMRTARQAEVDEAWGKLERAKVKYTIPATEPGAPPVEFDAEPNAELTRWVREKRTAIDAEVGEVVSEATQINRAGKVVLVEALFPEPSSGEGIFKKLEIAEKLVGKGEGRPSVYSELLGIMNAGKPADPAKAAADIEDLRTREIEKIKAERGSDKMSEEEEAALKKTLSRHRIGVYQQRARQISVYADVDSFSALIPTAIPPVPKETWEYFVWQWDYWVAQDVARAIAEANTAGGELRPLEQAPVKRLLSVKIDDLPIYGDTTLANEEWTADTTTTGAPLDPKVSITGRRSSKLNKVYDVRTATVSLVADSARIQDVINAFGRTNFMTVVDLDLRPVDEMQDLDEGYYYGPSHVVRADLRVETVWLRSWTADLMPDRLRIELGMEARDPNAALEAAAAAPAPPPPAPTRRAPDEDVPTMERGTGRGGGGGG